MTVPPLGGDSLVNIHGVCVWRMILENYYDCEYYTIRYYSALMLRYCFLAYYYKLVYYIIIQFKT